jgi:hypothetical protein
MATPIPQTLQRMRCNSARMHIQLILIWMLQSTSLCGPDDKHRHGQAGAFS